jgi:hypothetical protein
MLELAVLGHDISITAANGDLAFIRLQLKATGLDKVAFLARRPTATALGRSSIW